jgi:hypothetical protein
MDRLRELVEEDWLGLGALKGRCCEGRRTSLGLMFEEEMELVFKLNEVTVDYEKVIDFTRA